MKILQKVNGLRPLDLQAICRFEADADFGATIIYDVINAQTSSRSLTLQLTSQKTQCKAQKRDATACGGTCAPSTEKTACCN